MWHRGLDLAPEGPRQRLTVPTLRRCVMDGEQAARRVLVRRNDPEEGRTPGQGLMSPP
jgi:hypothetical protein